MSYASQGIGSSGHIAGEQFRLLTKTDIVHVPYKGAAPALQDLIAGRVAMMFDIVPFALQHIRDGSVRGLAVAAPQRVAGAAGHPDHGRGRLSGRPGRRVVRAVRAGRHAARRHRRPEQGGPRCASTRRMCVTKLEPRGVVLVLGTPAELGAWVAADTER